MNPKLPHLLSLLAFALAPALALAQGEQPTSLRVHPEAVELAGARAGVQLVISGVYADSSVRDLTTSATVEPANRDLLAIDEGRYLTPRRDGSTSLLVRVGALSVRVPVVVRGLTAPDRVSFRRELIAVLNVGGCNSGACHGTPTGKNGFRLSLRGFDPEMDYAQLTGDVLGRRTARGAAEASLLWLKGLGQVPHEGGCRFPANSVPAQALKAWLAQGMPEDPADLPALRKIEVAPGARLLRQPADAQQLAVTAVFADGARRDVTRLTVFSSSEPAIASVDAGGRVQFSRSGEVAILCRYLDELVPVRLTYLEPKPGFQWSDPPVHNFIDTHVFRKLKMLNLQPSELCTDQEFIRRATMDLCGVLPTPEETRGFLRDRASDKRARLIDTLLERPEYADQWTLKWSDVFRSTRKVMQTKGTLAFQKWLRDHLEQNTPFDRVVGELLASGGSTYGNAPANFYRVARDPQSLAETTAQLFLGIRMQCAKCHNHPFERWTQDDYYSLAAFFARVKLRKDPLEPGVEKKDPGAEYVYVDRTGEVTQPRTGKVVPPRFMGGELAKLDAGLDRREALARWLTSPQNPFFAKALVNRVWFHVMGRGIVDPVDDFRDSNPSANDELLDALAKDFVDGGFDLKRLLRTIAGSRTYQLGAQVNEFNKDDDKYFSHAVTKLHTAEQLFDALCYVAAVPEKFAAAPLGTRAMQLAEGEANHPFLKTFGQPARELACECERESDSNLAQALQLINGPAVNGRLMNPNNRIGKLLAARKSDREILEELFLVTLSRFPEADEAQAMIQHVQAAVDRRKGWEDVHWALINSKEFLFRH